MVICIHKNWRGNPPFLLTGRPVNELYPGVYIILVINLLSGAAARPDPTRFAAARIAAARFAAARFAAARFAAARPDYLIGQYRKKTCFNVLF